MSAAVRASLVIVAYNSARHLPACLESLLPTLGATDEVLVVDCASTDGSADVADGYPVRVVRSERNVGYGGGGNLGAARAAGRFLVFLNPDTVVEPGWLDALLEPIATGPGLVTAKIVLYEDPDRIDASANSVHLSGITVRRGHGQPAAGLGATERVLAVSGCVFAIDRASFEHLGGFDERFFMYVEDTDLSLRAAVAGLPIWYAGRSRVRHNHLPAFRPGKLFWLERNRLSMLLKVWSTGTLLRLLPTVLFVELLTWAFALRGGPTAVSAKARAWLWVLANLPSVLARRRAVQRLRRVHDRELLRRCAWRLDLTELVGAPLVRRVAEAGLAVPLAACRLALGRV